MSPLKAQEIRWCLRLERVVVGVVLGVSVRALTNRSTEALSKCAGEVHRAKTVAAGVAVDRERVLQGEDGSLKDGSGCVP